MALTKILSQVEAETRATPDRPGDSLEESRPLYALTAFLVAAATSWFLLKELGPLLRPLILAIFMAYLVVPIHQSLRRHVSATASAVAIVVATLAISCGLASMIYGSIVDLNADMPRLIDRGRKLIEEARAFGRAHLPSGLVEASPDVGEAEARGWDTLRASIRALVSNGATLLTEASVVAIYLIFLLLELPRFPRRIRAGFEPKRAETVLAIVARINTAAIHYLRAKTLASLATGIPSAAILWAFGVRHPMMWGVLIFLGNFVPYVGSLVAVAFPVLLAFVDLHPVWRPCVVTLLLVMIQAGTGSVVEPILTGKAVDLSPLVTLLCLAFWSLCWGLTGMLLAVPLTAMMKIIWENMASTRPLAALMAEGDG